MLNVLIVEDDPMVAEINKSYLSMTGGFSLVGVAGSGDAALACLQGAAVDLMLLDVFMPGMDGLSLLREVRENYPDVDVIMVTAARASADIQTALRLGVIDYIVKPFTLERFQAALIAYKERVRLLDEADEFDQESIDRNIFSAKERVGGSGLPKGIDESTLAMVKDIICAYPGEFFIKDIVPLSNLSRVSLKKYLDYLEASGLIQSALSYAQVGRPSLRYSLATDSGQKEEE